MMTTPNTYGSAKPVVTELRNAYKKLAIAEANIDMLAKMVRNMIGTNDVRNFICKQVSMRRVNATLDKKAIKKLMRRKLDDACAHASRLRSNKQKLKKRLQSYGAVYRKVVGECETEFRVIKANQRYKNSKKYEWCAMKQEKIDVESSVPEEVLEYVRGINVFNEEVDIEPAAGPMICSKSIKVSKEELMFLENGPRFMIRSELDTDEFRVEVEKMIAKETLGENDMGTEEECENEDSSLDERDEQIEKRVKEEEARSRMTYDKVNKGLDLGNLRASDYKYNKFIHLPKPRQACKESMNEVRRVEMIKVFDKIKKKIEDDVVKGCKTKRRNNTNSNSNLTDDEIKGMKYIILK